MFSGKIPGFDSILGEVYAAGGPQLIWKLIELFQSIWNQEEIPQDFKDALIVHLYKWKGNRQVSDNHIGISLLSSIGEFLARTLLDLLTQHVKKDLLLGSQCGLWQGCATVDIVIAAWLLQEKCQEQNINLFSLFMDLTKVFCTVSHDVLWKIMYKFNFPDWLIPLARHFYVSCLQVCRMMESPHSHSLWQMVSSRVV